MDVECCQKLFMRLLRWSFDFYFQFVNVVYHIVWFVDIEKSLHPLDKSHLIMVYDPFNVLLAVVLLYMAFIMLRYVCSISTLFILNECWILSNTFSAPIEMITWFLSFILLMWCITFVDLHMLNHPCILTIHKQKNEIGPSSYTTHKN